jgi:hypothetical protein
MGGLVLSGITALPLETESALLHAFLRHAGVPPGCDLSIWLRTVQRALSASNAQYPFLSYGTDWLGFAHLVIAVAFVGPWRDPVRNQWVITFGLACAGVLPLALIAGAVRGIPFYWRLVDCSFGVAGAIPLWRCRRLVARLERVGG